MITTDAYFENIREEILKELELASKSVYVAVAWFTEKKLFKKLIALQNKGIAVFLIVADDSINHQSAIHYQELADSGGFFKYISGELMHNKFCIIDKRVVITGSYNWTNKASTKNQENITITQGDFDLAFRFINQFNNIADIETPPVEKSELNHQIKRLSIIKELISLGDDEDIKYQCNRLRTENLDSEVEQILDLLEINKFNEALNLIESFIYAHSRIAVYIDPRISALQLEIKNIKFRIISVDSEIAEKQRKINYFNNIYYRELGELISKILELKKIYYGKFKDKSKYHKEDYEQAKEEQEEFSKNKKQLKDKNTQELTDEEKKKLKKLHRKGVVLCHPDKVSDDLKDKAQDLFTQLQSAYESQNLQKLTEIISKLENGDWDKIKDKDIVDVEILLLKKQQLEDSLSHKITELQSILQSTIFKEMNNLSDFDNYFKTKKQELESELVIWQNRVK